MKSSRTIHILNAEVARKIAAGEVIDRPAAIVRELLDNAIDSGADTIRVEIEGGGIDKIRIVDNGCGMTKEDLAVCARPHATSKISTEADLMNLSTLGFRGEALSSIAAVSYLSINSGMWHMRASVTEDHIIEPVQPVNGTIVQSQALFENFPARRQFLKRPATEAILCKNIFIEKTIPCTGISFNLAIDGKQKLNLHAGQSLTQRFVQATGITEREELFYELAGSSDGFLSSDTGETKATDKKTEWTFRIVIGEPSVYRNDRKLLYIYVNGRRIAEYSLMQAIEYGGQGYFPNGAHPVAALFVNMNPALVDFNIHPAKKEVRFKDISTLHHAISTTVRNFFREYTLKTIATESTSAENGDLFSDLSRKESIGTQYEKNSKFETASDYTFSQKIPGTDFKQDSRSNFFSKSDAEIVSNHRVYTQRTDKPITDAANYDVKHMQPVPVLAELASSDKDDFRYIGQTLGVFLVAERHNILYIIDQHAAHERILYNKIIENKGRKQSLLVPYVIETMSESDDSYLESIKEKLEDAGYSAKNCGEGRWEFSSVPERWQGTENDLAHALLDKHLEPDEIISSLAATSACKAAIKDGGILDDSTAAKLAKEALDLPDPHCPHGRPIFTSISRDELFMKVRRT